MADKKATSSGPSLAAFEIAILSLIFVGIIGMVANWLNSNKEIISVNFKNIVIFLINIYSRYVIFSIFLSILLFIIAYIYGKKEFNIRKKIMSKILPKEGEVKNNSNQSFVENLKWKLIEEHINSDDASKWRLAILEADIMLYELLDSLQISGDGVGEKLKNIETSDFDTLDQAWEAHKIRNAIAHQGSDFLITQKEAKRVLKLYESVFKEFEII